MATHRRDGSPDTADVTVLEMFRSRAERTPDAVAFEFLGDGERTTAVRTWSQLAARAQAVAASLDGEPGDRVLLAFDEGLDFLDAFFGCLWAGRLGVPVHAPDPARPDRTAGRLTSIARDAQIHSVLTTSDLVDACRLLERPITAVDRLPDAVVAPTPHWLAYLQYTSGSTSEPKGVRISQRNLSQNLLDQDVEYQHGDGGTIVTWLPAAHDLGLVYGRLMTVWTGMRCVFLSPATFVQRPARWMRAMSAHGGTHSPSPNFGYDLAAQRVSDEDLAGVDLSRVRMLLNGAEPIRPQTEERFVARYQPYGLRVAVTHSYGMAEATAKLTTEPLGRVPGRFVSLDPVAYERNEVVVVPAGSPRARVCASNGHTLLDTRVFAVDPDSFDKLPDGRVGELWVAGTTVSDGYWNRPEQSLETFGSRTSDGDGPFLRTGDLGFVLDREIYVSGRKKDVIIVRGQNLHPPDLERDVEQAHRAIRPAGVAAIGLTGADGEETLGVVAEIAADADAQAVIGAIRKTLAELGQSAATVALVPPRALPKTSSGKLQRRETRARLEAGTLPLILRVDAARAASSVSPLRAKVLAATSARREALLLDALRAAVASALGLDPGDVEVDRPVLELGVDSITAVTLVADLSTSLGVDVPRTALFEHPSVEAMARHLATRLPPADDDAGPGPARRPTPAVVHRPRDARAPIAVVGLACRFPGHANDPDAFWRLLVAGEPVAGPVPLDRWDHAAIFQAGDPADGKTNAARISSVDHVADFDAAFFGISDPEALYLDPQQRMLLEVAWEALEDAGIRADALAESRTGVFVGAAPSHWAVRIGDEGYRSSPYGLTGTDLSFTSGRLSYVLGLRGPSTSVSTACSSSLVALHDAVKSLQDGGCNVAIAGGVALLSTPDTMIALSQVGALSPDGTCKTFDAAADGYGRGEGCGLVVLKRLDDALAAGDTVLGVIRGAAVNHDGRSSGLTAPSGPAQTELIGSALADAGLTPADVDYLECHGTGTVLGDPIEVRAAGVAYGPGHDRDNPLWIGSAKAVVGHLEAAAAMAGLFKVLLSLRHELIPANRVTNFNPELPFDEFPLKVVTEPRPWPRGDRPRRAALSSFGLSGTNAHLVVEEPPVAPASTTSRSAGPHLWALSGRSEEAVRAYAGRLLAAPIDPADAGRSLVAHRAWQDVRSVLVGDTTDALREAADRLVVGTVKRGTLAFVFAGGGAQKPGMGAESYARHEPYRVALDGALAALAPHVRGDLRAVLWSDPSPELDLIEWSLPALFAVQIAQAATWRSLGVEPWAVIGHSAGEFAAAVVAGVLSLEDGARLIAHRARLMGTLPAGGAMVAIGAGEDEVRRALVPGAELGVVNGPRAVVISGEERAVASVADGFAARGVKVNRLAVSMASHSHRVEGVLDALGEVARATDPHTSKVRVLQTGGDGVFASPGYWVGQLRNTVRFQHAVTAAIELGVAKFLELGPTPVLSGVVAQTAEALGAEIAALPTSATEGSETAALLRAAGGLWVAGHDVPLADLAPKGARVALPRTVWQHRRFWIDAAASAAAGALTGVRMLGVRLSTAGDLAVFEDRWSLSTQPWLADHQVGDRAVVPGAAIFEVLASAARLARGDEAELEGVVLERPVQLPADGAVTVQIHVSPSGDVHLWSRSVDSETGWVAHASAVVGRAGASAVGRTSVDALLRGLSEIPLAPLRETFAVAGLRYGPAFRGATAVWAGEGRAVVRVAVPDGVPDDFVQVNPALLDAVFQAGAVVLPEGESIGLPFELARYRARAGARPAWGVVTRDGEGLAVRLLDAGGTTVAELSGLRIRSLRSSGARTADALSHVAWRDVPAPPPADRVGRWAAVRGRVDGLVSGSVADVDHAVFVAEGPVAALVTDLVAACRALPAQTTLWVVGHGPEIAAARAFLRSFQAEHAGAPPRSVELEPGADVVSVLAREAAAVDVEPAVWWSGDVRRVARLVRDRDTALPDAPSFRLDKPAGGELSALRWVAAERRAPGAGEVEVEVVASGLNFKDVLVALGVVHVDHPLGLECSGRVVRVGDGVRDLDVGDLAMVQSAGSLARYVTVDARQVSPLPAGVGLEAAAGVPAVFLTAWMGLVDLAGLKRGEKVLIHAAAGGVGMAAVQLAQWLGAEVYTTASASKWPTLRALGVTHLASSRDTTFAQTWRDAGVDVVLNSLAGEFVDAGLSLLRPGGRFVELGKSGLRDPADVLAATGVVYRAFDLAEAGPHGSARMFESLLDGFATGALRALPTTYVAVSEVEGTFRSMAAGQHVGKLVVRTGAGFVRPDGAVLVSGGTGALGKVTARWLADRGARSLVLMSRRGADAPGVAALVAELADRGVAVTTPAIDVADAAAVKALVASLGVPVRGVVHAAGALADGRVQNLDDARIHAALAPKVDGLAALEAATAGADLDLFLVYSSGAAVFGNPGQAAYGAANAWMDGRMAARRAAGLRGQSLQWGPWSDEGLAKGADFDGHFVLPVTNAEGAELLEAAVRRDAVTTVVAPLALGRVRGAVPALLRDLVRTQKAARPVASGAFAASVTALPLAERLPFVLETVRGDVARVLGRPVERVGDGVPLQELGMDSLLAVELRNTLSKRLGERLSATIAFDHPNVGALARHLLSRVAPAEEVVVAAAAARPVDDEPIAIVGMACRFPGSANDPEAFWDVVAAARPVAGPVPIDRWDHAAVYQAGEPAPGKTNAAAAAFVDDVATFDAAFFGITPAEARILDPQQRLLLEVGWEAIEDAGIPHGDLEGSRTGVYVGAHGKDWSDRVPASEMASSPYGATGTDAAFVSGRFAYVLGLRGPNFTLNTGCSSSLVSLHLAANGLRNGECDLALAAGVSLLAHPEAMVALAQIGALSADGTCKTFDAAADGFGRGEGCGVLVLKRLSDAVAAGDRVHAVIRGTAINHDGRASGLTAPSGPSQELVLRAALAAAKVDPADVDLLECHGTGTVLGDPIEVGAIAAVYGERREAGRPLHLTSAKAVIGHAEFAAAIAGVFKVVLALRHEAIPHTIFGEVNPELALGDGALVIPREPVRWARGDRPRLAAVSSFGISGTNGHVLIEEAPAPARAAPRPASAPPPWAWALSGRSDAGVRDYARALLALDADQGDVASSLLRHRPSLEQRAVIVGSDAAALSAAAERLEVGAAVRGPMVFVFNGGGAQRAGMGAESYARDPAFRGALDAALAALQPHVRGDLRSILWSDAAPELNLIEWSLPALFAVQVAQCAAWRAVGVQPWGVIGHSAGEFAAAYVAGVLTLPESARLIATRARLMGTLPPGGAMVAVGASEADVRAALVDGAGVGVVNGPRSVVVSGREDAVTAVAQVFAARGVKTNRLAVSMGSHSALTEPILPALRAAAEETRPSSPAIRVFATGGVGAPFGTPDYWVGQLRHTVRFRQAIEAAAAAGVGTYVEIGPTPVLTGLVGQTLEAAGRECALVPTAAAEGSEAEAFLRAIGGLWVAGHEAPLRAVTPTAPRIDLPHTAWQRERHWIDLSPEGTAGTPTARRMLGARLSTAGEAALFEDRWSAGAEPWLADHRVGGQIVVPGAALFEVMLAAGEEVRGPGVELQGVALERPVVLPEAGALTVQVHVSRDGEVVIWSKDEDAETGWVSHASGTVTRGPAPAGAHGVDGLVAALELRDLGAVAAAFAASGIVYGPAFQGVIGLWGRPGTAVVRVSPPPGTTEPSGSGNTFTGVPPAVLDAVFQGLIGTTADLRPEGLPFALGSYRARRGATAAWGLVERRDDGADVTVLDAGGRVVASLVGLKIRARQVQSPVDDALFRDEWVDAPTAVAAELPGRWVTVVGAVAGIAAGDAADADHAVFVAPADPRGATLALVELCRSLPASTTLWAVGSGAAAAAVRGFVRALDHERGAVRALDVDPGAELLPILRREAAAVDNEPVVRIRGEVRSVARVVRVRGATPPDAPTWFLDKAASGELGAMRFAAAERRAPGHGEVEIEVLATALNFRDVMNALGMYPGDAGRLGTECSGRVARVGAGVSNVDVDDLVMAQAQGAFARYVVVDARQVSLAPPDLTPEGAASVPIGFLTAWYGLRELASLQAGDRVLIHAAAGGVGIAAVQVAKWVGAEVYATASPAKWALLRGLGVTHLASSRDTTFAQTWRDAGITVVLNSLAKEFVDAGLSLLRPGGRFIEMGKTDIRDADALRLGSGVTYRAFDLAEAGPDGTARMFAEIHKGLALGALRPPPLTTWPLGEVESAFRTMAGGSHVGKLVIRTGAGHVPTDGAVLVSGGLGALGLVTARWLADRGARTLVLLSRRGSAAPGAAEITAELGARGVTVHTPAADVTDLGAMQAVVRDLGVPVRGVVHAAGVLADGLARSQDAERALAAWTPKIDGLHVLESITADQDLDLFLVFSSVAAVLGNAGQTVYAAANAVMDHRMAERRARGLAGQSVQWGAWSEVGLATDVARDDGLLGPIPTALGSALLEAVVRRGDAVTMAAPMRLTKVKGDVPSALRGLVRARPKARAAAASGAFASGLAPLDPAERQRVVLDAVRADVAKVLAVPVDKVGDAVPLQELGMDSLLAVELRNTLSRRVGERLSATVAFDHPNVGALATFLLGRLRFDDVAAPAVPEAVVARAATPDEPIAIVGMACRFPGGADDPALYWDVLSAAVPVAGPIPADRWDHAAIYQPGEVTPGRTYADAASLVRDIASFDAGFFGIPGAEAELLDPQQRLMLEVGWEALEDAGVRVDSLRESRTGVFVGTSTADWARRLGTERMHGSAVSLTGTDLSFVPGRFAYTLGLRGPVVQINTACSSALVALHQASRALAAQECDLAVAAGVSLITHPDGMVVLAQTQALAPDGVCKTFDAAADGFGRGEGVGVIVLKRLSDARRDGDTILGVVRGSAVNHDGRSSGLTAPSGPAQQAVMREALAAARVAPDSVDYFECHGTGTVLGDPIEVRALAEVYAADRDPERPLWLGSSKAIVGHLEAAAASAGLFKILLAMRHGQIPPNPVRSTNPELPLAEFPLRVVTQTMPWARSERPRRAAISSFGLSGTNAHVILEEPPAATARPVVRGDGPYLWPVSARSEEGVAETARALAAAGAHPADVGATLWTHRAPLEVRAALVGDDAQDLAAARVDARTAKGGGVAFVFSGQGSQRPGAGTEAYLRFDTFRLAFDAAIEACRPHVHGDLRAVMLGDGDAVDHTEWTQPAIFVLQVAQAAWWRSLGVEPRWIVGHSVGEFAAAVVAGVLPLEDAARIVCRRGRAMGELPPGGAMVAIGAAEADVRAALVPGAEIGAVNGPRSVSVTGDAAAVEAVGASFAAKGVRTTRLVVSHAFHSARIEPALGAIRDAAEGVEPRRSDVVLPTGGSEAPFGTAAYWVDQARGSVHFADAIRDAHRRGAVTFVELGARPTLGGLVGQTLSDADPALVATGAADGSELRAMLQAAGAAWASGVSIDLTPLLPAGARVALPATARIRQRYWLDMPLEGRVGEPTGHRLLGARLPTAGDVATFEVRLSPHTEPWLVDHVVAGRIVVAGAAVFEALRAAGERVLQGPVELQRVSLERPLVVPPGGLTVQTQVAADGTAQLWSRTTDPDEGFVLHASGVVVSAPGPLAAEPWAVDGLTRDLRPMSADDARASAARSGVSYGPAFQGMAELWGVEGRAVARIERPDSAPDDFGALSPPVLDVIFQASLGTTADGTGVGLPFELGSYRSAPNARAVWAVIERRGEVVDATALDADGRVVARIGGLRMRPHREAAAAADIAFRELWVSAPSPAGASLPGRWGVVRGHVAGLSAAEGDVDHAVFVADGDPVAATLELAAVAAAIPAATTLWIVGTGEAVATARGFARSYDHERTSGRPRVVDHDEGADVLDLLAREVAAGDADRVVRWRAAERAVPRLARDGGQLTPHAPSWRLERAASGELSGLRFAPVDRRAPGAGEVEIEVLATGLNFRDVMNALGAYPGDAGQLGVECAGRVVRAGSGAPFAVGALVLAVAQGSFSRFVTVDARYVIASPAGLSPAHGAAVPTAFATAWYALVTLADLQPGQKVLIHAAAGGVGSAAVQIARWRGAVVYGTASPAKWEVLRRAGVEHVASSRDLTFATTWREVGFDVVLDALAREFVDAGLSLVRKGGLFLEMGKTDLRDAAQVERELGVRYRAFDLTEVDADGHAEILGNIARGFADGVFAAPIVTTYPLAELETGFRTMASGGHVGKLVFLTGAGAVRPDGAVLVSGGTGALGAVTLRWLADRGARTIVALSRRGGDAPGVAALVAELAERGVDLRTPAVDVADEAALRGVVAGLGLPVRGVVHAAGVIADALVRNGTPEQALRVLRPKIVGLSALEAVTDGADLDLFVVFSSVAGVFGNAGQSVYGAANAFLDARMASRRARGLPGQSLQWGPWSGAGMARDLRLDGVLAPFDEAAGRAALEALVRRGATVSAGMSIRLAQVRGDVPAVLRGLVKVTDRAKGPPRGGFAGQLLALPAAERDRALLEGVRADVAKVLGLPLEKVGDGAAFQELGMDSLLAVELRNAVARRIGDRLPATLAFDHPNVAAVATFLKGHLQLAEAAAPAPAPAAPRRPRHSHEPIAIVGMSCRFPGGAEGLEAYWQVLERAEPVAAPVPADRWDHAAYWSASPQPNRYYARRFAQIRDVAGFDPSFFGMSEAEATLTDPQQRLFVEAGWEALEHAGARIDDLAGSATGVFVGIVSPDYTHRLGDAYGGSPYAVAGMDLAFAAGRFSYLLGLRGPAMSLSSACSSSLVALHNAVQSLRSGESDLAVAGGVNAITSPISAIQLSQAQALSPDGTCKTFDAAADGYGRGEGVGVLVLERLSDAIANGRRVWAVIRGSAVNHDGASSGLTVPSGPAQRAVVGAALRDGGIDPAELDYVECHGTGTKLGDPIEVRALGEATSEGRPADRPLLLGSAKAVVGHLEAAAGVAGVVKVVLAMQKERLPHNVVREFNPELPLDDFPLEVVTTPRPWRRSDRPRRAGVSSFGLSGTNAHVVLEEAPAPPPFPTPDRGDGPWLWPVSARSDRAVRELAATLAARDDHPADLARSLVSDRAALEVRAALVGLVPGDFAAAVGRLNPVRVRSSGTVFVFGGQGSQRLGMGAESYARFPAFRLAFDAAVEALRPHLPSDLRAIVWGSGPELDHTAWTQPGLFALQIAQVALWRSVGVVPVAVIGHSVGEFAAAVTAGVSSLEDAARLVATRGLAMGALPTGGAMAAIGASEADVRAALVPGADVAAVNGPTSVTVSGDEDAVRAVVAAFSGRGVRTTNLTVSHAFHSARMEPMLGALRDAAAGLTVRDATVRVFPTAATSAPFASPAYWVDQARGHVAFAAAVAAAAAGGHTRFLELGARPTLLGLVGQVVTKPAPALVATSTADGSEVAAFLAGAGAAWASGAPVDLAALTPAGRRVALPTMAWQNIRCWVEDAHAPPARPATSVTQRIVWSPAPVGLAEPLPSAVNVVGSGPLKAAIEAAFTAAHCHLSAEAETVVVVPPAGGDDDEHAIAATLEVARAARTQARWWWIVTQGAVDRSATPADPAQRAALGFGRSLRVETSGAASVVDVDPALPVDARARQALDAITAGRGPEVAWIDGARCHAAFVPVTDERPSPAMRGTWLVTGGLGALGSTFARWLVDRGVTDLVLTGRSAPNAEAATALDALRARGATVTVAQADVAVRSQLDGVLAAIEARGGVLRGVIHAAGVLDDGFATRQTDDQVQRLLAPKIRGAWNLHRATHGRELDAFVLCSSLAASGGSAGQTAYSAGNAFLDGLAERRRRLGAPAVSVAWGPWAEVGMAARLGSGHLDRLVQTGVVPMSNDVALGALERVLGGEATVVVADLRAPDVPKRATPRADGTGVAAIVAGKPRAEWPAIVEAEVRRVVARSGVVDPDPEKALWDQGMDSMKLVEVRNELARGGVDLPMASVMSGPPLAKLVELVLEALNAAEPEVVAAPTDAASPTPHGPPRDPDELEPLSPVASHLLAAVGGAIACFLVTYAALWSLGFLR